MTLDFWLSSFHLLSSRHTSPHLFLCRAGDWTQDLRHVRQVNYTTWAPSCSRTPEYSCHGSEWMVHWTVPCSLHIVGVFSLWVIACLLMRLRRWCGVIEESPPLGRMREAQPTILEMTWDKSFFPSGYPCERCAIFCTFWTETWGILSS